MAVLYSVGVNVLVVWWAFFPVVVVVAALEWVFPRRRVSVSSQLHSLLYWLFAGVGTGAAYTLWQHVLGHLQPEPIYVVPLNRWFAHPSVHWLLYILAPLLGVILYDFFDYWMHRAQHKWFWRFHAIHHSIEELSGINSYFHWTEQFFRVLFILLPAAYLVGIDGVKTTMIAELLIRIQGYYLHSPTTIHLGSIGRRLLADNRFHRIHHSIHPHHFDKNFGAGTTLWDQLFGTAHFPVNDEWPQTGMGEQAEVRSLSEYLWSPFARGVQPMLAADLRSKNCGDLTAS